MSYSFEDVMAYHPDNQSVYDELKESLHSLVPFVGAGLTVFAYGTWRDALNKQADKITDKENKS